MQCHTQETSMVRDLGVWLALETIDTWSCASHEDIWCSESCRPHCLMSGSSCHSWLAIKIRLSMWPRCKATCVRLDLHYDTEVDNWRATGSRLEISHSCHLPGVMHIQLCDITLPESWATFCLDVCELWQITCHFVYMTRLSIPSITIYCLYSQIFFVYLIISTLHAPSPHTVRNPSH